MTSPSTATDTTLEASVAEAEVRLQEQAPELFQRLLRDSGGYADLFYECSHYHQRSLRQVTTGHRLSRSWQTDRQTRLEGTGLRVLAAEQTGYAATDDLTRPALLAAASTAAAQVQGTGAGPAAVPVVLEVAGAPPVLPVDAPHRVGAAEKQVLLEAVADAAFAFDEAVAEVEASYQEAVRQVLLLTSEGHVVRKAASLLGLRVVVTLRTSAGPVTATALSGGTGGFGYFFLHRPEDLACEAVNRALVQAQARPLPEGHYPVVLGAGWGGAWLHEAVGHRLEADALAGARPVRPGTRLARPDVHLSDDPWRPEGRATMQWDDEAHPTAPVRLVEAGVVTALLTDRAHTMRYGLPGTGHARRQDYRQAPLPRMTNLILEPGTATPADLLADVSDGLYVTMPGSGRVEPEHDRFVLEVVEGWRIVQGRLTVPVNDVVLEGTLSTALDALVGVGNDPRLETARGVCRKAGQSVPVSVEMPTVLLSALQVRQARIAGNE
jgi:TldD protein